MTLTARQIARHIIILIVILVTLTALSIWLELGPVVHSSDRTGPKSKGGTCVSDEKAGGLGPNSRRGLQSPVRRRGPEEAGSAPGIRP